MDGFVDSSWYYLRYCSPEFTGGPFDAGAVRRWCPAQVYIGGAEHATLHLLYVRFFAKVLHDLGLVDFAEPFRRLINQGQVINQGKAMSKSLGNGVDLGAQLAEHGVDAIRLTMIFASPPDEDIDWADMRPEACVRFLGRVMRVAADVAAAGAPAADGRAADGRAANGTVAGVAGGDLALRRVTHQTIEDVTRLVGQTRLNVAVARLMTLVTAARRAIDSGPGAADPAVREAAEVLAVLLSLFAPYTAEECWATLGRPPSVATTNWPAADPSLLAEESVTCVVQVNGKLRDRLRVPPGIGENDLRELALTAAGAVRALEGARVAAVIVRAPRLVNIVASAPPRTGRRVAAAGRE